MKTMAEMLLEGPAIELTLYPPESRYHGVLVAEIVLPSGRTVRYLRRRFLPDPADLATLVEHRVVDADRLDNLAARYLGDPLASWRIADGNGAMRMEELVEQIGRRLGITLPTGVPGNRNA